jgi:hypothetical protein
MNYDQAKAIAAQYAPTLIVDPPSTTLARMFVVRASQAGHPFSIHLDDLDPAMYPPIAAQDAVAEIPASPATVDRPAMPPVPARPAVVARTTEGQIAEQEQILLKHALDAALKFLS